MDQPLLTIGAFARAVGLAPSALRYYDDCGLLTPAEVDEATGYRYYTPELARRATTVVRMREAGVPVAAMRTVLDGTAEDRRRILREVLSDQESLTARRTAVLQELLADESRDPSTVKITVNGTDMSAALRQVSVAAETDTSSPLSGILLDVAAGTVDVVATDRYWMAVRTLPSSPAEEGRVVVASSHVESLCALLDPHDQVSIEIDEDRVRVGDDTVEARDIAYPAHRMLIAGLPAPTVRMVLPKAELLAAVESFGHAEFDLDVTEGGVVVGRHEVAGVVSGPGLSLRLGAALTRRALGCALGPSVVLHASAESRPVQVTSPHQAGFLALLMPVARSAPHQ